MKPATARKMRTYGFQSGVTLIAAAILLLAFVPIFLMIFLSLKLNYQIHLDFWAPPSRRRGATSAWPGRS